MKLTHYKYEFLLKKPKIIPIEFMIVVIIISTLFLLFSYKTYDVSYAKMKVVKNEDKYFGIINVDEVNYKLFNEKTVIKLNQETRKFSVEKISDSIGDETTGFNYQQVMLQLYLKEEERKENIYLDLMILNNKQKLFNKIINLFK